MKMRGGTSHLLESQYLQSTRIFKSSSTSIAWKFLLFFFIKKIINQKKYYKQRSYYEGINFNNKIRVQDSFLFNPLQFFGGLFKLF